VWPVVRNGFVRVAGATGVAALLTLLLYRTAVSATTATERGAFTVFWFAALIMSFGVFLPLEQVVSRVRTHGPVPRAAVLRPALVLAAIAVVGVVAVSPLLGLHGSVRLWVVTALVVLALVSALQYAARGLALGSGRMDAYAGALVADAGVRAGVAFVVGLLVVHPPGAVFVACVVGSALVAHAGLLLVLQRPGPDRAPVRTGAPVTPQDTTRAVLALLGASLAAQVLLNAAPIVVAHEGLETGAVAAYGAAFTLARIPLFAVVPAQSVLVPPLTRMVAEGRHHELRVRMAQLAAAVAVLAVLGAGFGWLLSGTAMDLFTSGELEVPRALMALLVAGCLVHAGLVIGTQALVATGRERRVLVCWLTGLAVAVVCALALQVGTGLDLSWTLAWSFTAGSAAAWLLSVLVLVQRPRTAPSAA